MGADNFSLYDTHQDDPELESAARARLLLAHLDGTITADEFTTFGRMLNLFQEDDTRTGHAVGAERRATARRHQSKGSGPLA